MRLFVSYAHVDEGRVAELASVLSAGGFEPWWDDRLEPGDDWKVELQRRIAACDAFVYVISTDSIESEWCQWELSQASALSKHIVPIIVRDGVAPPPPIASLQYLDVSRGLTGHDVARLVGKLARLGQVGGTSVPPFEGRPAGIPARFARPLPTSYRTIAQGYLQLQSPATTLYTWPNRSQVSTKLPGRIVGVDFGTTVSSLAVTRSDTIELIPNDLGETSTPSAVAIAEDGTPLVGQRAFDLLLRRPDRGVLEVKRLLGHETAAEIGGTPILDVDGIGYAPVDLAAFILRQLREDAEAHLGGSVTRAVLTAPAYFDHSQHAALMQAAAKAGFVVMRVVPEPVAACMGLNLSEEDRSVLVYDLGGGTFDVSVLECGGGVFEVRAVNGDTHIGGADFDRMLVDYCIDEFRQTTGVDLRGNAEALMRIREAAERAKITLSATRNVTVNVPFVSFGTSGPLHLATQVTRTRYHELTHKLVVQTIKLTRRALDDAAVSIANVDQLIVVGRAARAPSVGIALQDLFGRPFTTAPDHIVAQGAAAQAAILEGQRKNYLLLDSLPRTLRVQLDSTRTTAVMVRHTTIPTRKSLTLTARRPGEPLRVRVMVGESSWVDRNVALLELEVPIPSHAKEQPLAVTLTLDIDANSRLTATAEADNRQPVSASLGLRQDVGDIDVASRRASVSEWSMLTPGDLPQLPPLADAAARKLPTVQRWLAQTITDLVLTRVGPKASSGQWQRIAQWLKSNPDGPPLPEVLDWNVLRIFDLERELVVDALEQRFRTDLAPVRYCPSIGAMAERLVNTLQSFTAKGS